MDNEEIKSTLGELEFFLKTHKNLPIEKRNKKYSECRHFQVSIDEEAHTVICRQCHKKLDPFWYLLLLAHEWSARRYTDSEAIEAFRALRQQELNAEAKGKIISRPQEGLDGIKTIQQEVWDTFIEWKHQKPNYIFRRGNEWYVNSREELNGREYNITYGFNYIKMELAGKKL